ncbi:MAG: leucine-rich repeat domain-containing protein [Bacteroidales bacterium]|nr:leucine-rich repeat domain-containing protein [Bacteroidales bacterium]
MRKLLLSLVAVLFAATAVGATVTINGVTYETMNNGEACAYAANTSITSAEVLAQVTINGNVYNVTRIGSYNGTQEGFENCTNLSEIILPEGIKQIYNRAFSDCDALDSIALPASLECFATNAFHGCNNLRVVNFLGADAPVFGCGNYSITNPTQEDVLYAFTNCPLINTLYLPFEADMDGYHPILHFFANIGTGNNQGGNEGGSGTSNFVINEGETVTIENGEIIIIPESAGVINNGNLVIEDGGQLVLGKDMTGEGGTDAMAGIVGTGVSGLLQGTNGAGNWCFIGAPFNGYKLAAVDAVEGDIAVSLWNYTSGVWSSDWATIANDVTRAEGFFAWPFVYEGELKFSTKPVDEGYENEKYNINNGDFEVTKNAAGTGGNWVALANPYTFNLDIATFLANQSGLAPYNNVQGGVVYTYNGANFVANVQGILEVADGFFLNYVTSGDKTISFKEKQGSWYTPTQSKSTATREFVTLTMFDGEIGVDVMFAQNEDAEQGYDIFDANKLFATTGVAEPYFVTDGIPLVKEEAKELPYYATMNVRTAEAKNVKFVAKNIPEGLAVSIIDGEEVVEMVEGAEYATEVSAGENANRFKVLVKKNVGLADVAELDVTIANSNRYISISTQEDVKVEVYNTLGQKVYETTETNFELNGVASGAYVVKAYNNKASKTQKIIVE